MATVQVAPFKSFVDGAFFKQLSLKKLNELHLSEKKVAVVGSYTIAIKEGRQPELSLGDDAFAAGEADEKVNSVVEGDRMYAMPGYVTNMNSLETFRELDKVELMRSEGLRLRKRILEGEVVREPWRLNEFFVITFADIKKYRFYYWFGFPAVSLDFKVVETRPCSEACSIGEIIQRWRVREDARKWGFFGIQESVKEDGGHCYEIMSLEQWMKMPRDLESKGSVTVGFIDPSTIAGTPGWPIRNFIAFLSSCGLRKVSILCYRDYIHPGMTDSVASPPRSFWLDINIHDNLSQIAQHNLKVSGWERNSAGKLVPKYSDIGSLTNPNQLADQAVDLNLKLMKWRVAPDLDLQVIKNNKCLLLGAGTLGSYISRGLMGWGVRKITFVDNGRVSFSNPVRQPLYTFKDCLDGGVPKAQRAADALKEIYPSVEAQGYELEIPMAGHPVTNEEKQSSHYDQLIKLIDEHDTIFLAMDSRESRWLPTVVASAKNKLVINVALGFDTYVVMRHGVSKSLDDSHNTDSETTHCPHLGCYFCNDVVAPVDSLSRQTLDQMCTVTRPGVAMLASAIACEMLTSLLQTKEKALCPAAPANDDISNNNSIPSTLSIVPHQIRGFLRTFDNIKIWGPSYPHCSACSQPIVHAWSSGGWDFVKQALNDPSIVNEISGLAEIQRKTDQLVLDTSDWDISD